jgi:hypothetical protein
MDAKKLAWLVTGALVVAPIAANAQAVTYDFTGTVTQAIGMYSSVPVGATVTGTYTFSLSSAIPSEVFGSVGSSVFEVYANQINDGATPAVFSSTAKVNGFSFASLPPNVSAYASHSSVANDPFSPSYYASETVCVTATNCSGSQFGASGAMTSGLPALSPASLASGGVTGEFFSNSTPIPSSNQVAFKITSMVSAPTAAPEIDAASAASGLTLLLGGLLVLGGRRSAVIVA